MNVLVSVVLVHGAFAESASWNRVIAPLTAAGHRVIAAGNPPRSVATDAAPSHRHRARRGLPRRRLDRRPELVRDPHR
jgi:hypothetical protein